MPLKCMLKGTEPFGWATSLGITFILQAQFSWLHYWLLLKIQQKKGVSIALSTATAKGDAVEGRVRTVNAPETQKEAVLLVKKRDAGRGILSTRKKIFVDSVQAEKYFV